MKYNGKEVVYIEYQNGKPHAVCTAELGKWSLNYWDFEVDCFDEDSFMHYSSGFGGYATDIQPPEYIEGCEKNCCYWIHPKARLNGEAKNIRKIEEPLIINNSKNPFDNSREVFDLIFCKHCDRYNDENFCEHISEDDSGDIVYFNGEIREM